MTAPLGSSTSFVTRADLAPAPAAAAGAPPAEGQPRADEHGRQPKDAGKTRSPDGQPLSEAEQRQVSELKQRDREVRAHEQAHKAAAGPHATSGPTYSFQTGPDGRRYAVGGEVGIDLSEAQTPQATLAKMQQVRRAALAPAEPSAQDRAVAAEASRKASEARSEIAEQRRAESQGESEGEDKAGSAAATDAAQPSAAEGADQAAPSREADATGDTPRTDRPGALLDTFA